jgi:hypothetical protein
MATTTLNPTSNNGILRSEGAAYSDSRAGTGSTIINDGSLNQRVGQYLYTPIYQTYEMFLAFDLSSLAGGSTITAAVLSLYLHFNDADTAFTLEARAYDYGPSLTNADWVPGGDLAALTLLASLPVFGIADTQYITLTDVAMTSYLVPGAINRMVLSSSRTRTNNAPTALEYITTYRDAEFGSPPILDLTYTPPAPSSGSERLALVGVGA